MEFGEVLSCSSRLALCSRSKFIAYVRRGRVPNIMIEIAKESLRGEAPFADDETRPIDAVADVSRRAVPLKTEILQNAILNSADFAIIATDAKGIIQLFNVGAERMLGYAASDVVNKITPSDLHDPVEVIARAEGLSAESGTVITPGFGALAFKASRG